MIDWLLQIPLIGGFLSYALPFFVLLTVVIFVHEQGHYLVARWAGVHADVFSIGFGPSIGAFTDSRGTRWRFCWILLGGYVRFRGDGDAASMAQQPDAEAIPGSFQSASVGRRAAIIAAGPFMNFIFSVAVLTFAAWFGGVPSDAAKVGAIVKPEVVAKLGLQEGDEIRRINGNEVTDFRGALRAIERADSSRLRFVVLRDGRQIEFAGFFAPEIKVAAVQSDSPAEAAGFEAGAIIRSVDGLPIRSFGQLQNYIRDSDGRALRFEVVLDNEMKILHVTPRLREFTDPETGEAMTLPFIGVVQAQELNFLQAGEPVSLFAATAFGLARTVFVVETSLVYFGQMVAGKRSADELGGPIAIAELSGDVAKRGWWYFAQMLALVSASIGLINLFPIPILDGGHLIFLGLEAVRKKPLEERVQRYVSLLGLTFILLLTVYVTYNDIARF